MFLIPDNKFYKQKWGMLFFACIKQMDMTATMMFPVKSLFGQNTKNKAENEKQINSNL